LPWGSSRWYDLTCWLMREPLATLSHSKPIIPSLWGELKPK
jgi:hypothetical protein